MNKTEIIALLEEATGNALNEKILASIDEKIEARLKEVPKHAAMTGQTYEEDVAPKRKITFSQYLGDMTRALYTKEPLVHIKDDMVDTHFVKAMDGVDPKIIAAMVASGDQRTKALYEGASASGGYLVPTEESRELLSLVDNYSVVERLCRSVPMKTNSITFPTLTGGLTMYWIPEATTSSVSTQATGQKQESAATFGQMSITAHVGAVLVYVSTQLLDDSDPAIDQILYGLFAETLGDGMDQAILTGAGSTTDPITGMDNFVSTNLNTAGAVFDFDDVIDLIYDVKINGVKVRDVKVIGHAAATKNLLKVKSDDGQYIYRPPQENAQGIASIWGHPYYEDGNITTTDGATSDKTRLYAGDFANHMFVGNRSQIIIKANPWGAGFTRNMVAFLAEFRKGMSYTDESNFAICSGVPT
ncbi:MAG: phage major capsid protein [Deltaproteobacteria bacterium]|nr:phage major capsid protein [Deltaproteobacteria bacterium]